MNVVKELISSKKFWALISAVITSLGAYLSDTLDAKETIIAILAEIGGFIGAQGLADQGKSAAKVYTNNPFPYFPQSPQKLE